MKVIILIGPHAVGKMTIGQALEKRSGLKLFHNHMAIEMVMPFFSYSTPEGRSLVHAVRQAFYDAFADSDAAGYILTFVWAFSEPSEKAYMDSIAQHFEGKGHQIYWIELEASLDERLRRNRTENRLHHKPSKRDLAWSEANLIASNSKYRLTSHEGEIDQPNYLRVDTTDLSADQTAEHIWRFVTSPQT